MNVVRLRSDGEWLSRDRLPESAQVWCNDAISIRQCIELRLPHARVERKAVNEHDRYAPATLLIMNRGAVDRFGWHEARIASGMATCHLSGKQQVMGA